MDKPIIKVDNQLVEGMDRDLMKGGMITFISRIAEVKNKDIILEGVEKEDEALAIKNKDIDLIYVQGYYYNKPLLKEKIKLI